MLNIQQNNSNENHLESTKELKFKNLMVVSTILMGLLGICFSWILFVLTQNEPFFLLDDFKYLMANLADDIELVGCVIFQGSPFGKKQSFLGKAFNTFKTFGSYFFLYYGLWFVANKLLRKPSVEEFMKSQSIPVVPIIGDVNSEESLELIRSFQPDLLISIAGNQIFKKELIEIGPKGCINLHTALLPKYRGLMPTFWALKNKEDSIGVSVFFVDEGVDSGPIICQQTVTVDDNSHKDMIKITKKIGMALILEAIDKIKTGNYTLRDNNDEESSYFSFPTRLDVQEFKRNGGKFF